MRQQFVSAAINASVWGEEEGGCFNGARVISARVFWGRGGGGKGGALGWAGGGFNV